VYFGSSAEASPAWKTPQRVVAEAASRAAPDSALMNRLRRAASAPAVPKTVSASRALM
jgi:hypothetical protein